MEKVGILVLGALLLAPATAESQTIHGVVVEDSTRAPIKGARVELVGAEAGTVARAQTDSAGTFLLRPPGPGSFTVRLTHPSFAPAEPVPVTVAADEAVRLHLRMGLTPIPIAPLVVRTRIQPRLRGFHERMQQPGSGQFLTRADIERRPGARTTDLLREMPSIEIVPVGRGRGAATVKLITVRGGLGRCQPTLYIDGTPVRQFAESGVDDLLKPAMLEGVEVYTRPADVPAEFVAPNSCGVVAFWTRSGAGEEGGRWSWKKTAVAVGAFVLAVVVPRLVQ